VLRLGHRLAAVPRCPALSEEDRFPLRLRRRRRAGVPVRAAL